jgi:hypothetical protein
MSPFIVGEAISAVGKIADDLFTSDEERAKADIEAMKVGLDAAKVDAGLISGQQEINKIEAAHSSVFVAGWRPAIGWTGVIALVYQFILYPLLTWAWAWMQAQDIVPGNVTAPPILDINALMVLMTGILGISTSRTFEKVRGVSGTPAK